MPKRIQLSRVKGSRLPSNAVKVDRTTKFGNPYCVGEPVDMKQVRRWGWSFSPQGRAIVCNCVQDAVHRFAHALVWDQAIHDFIRDELGGKDLACWCKPDEPCHADVLLIVANSKAEEVSRFYEAAEKNIFDHAREIVRAGLH